MQRATHPAIRAAALVLLVCAATPLAAQIAIRDPLAQPFAVDSIWNMPIGTGAQYVPINMAPNPSGSIWTPMPQIDDEYLFLDANAPLTNINLSSAAWSGANRCNATGGLLVQVPFAANYVVPNSLGNNAAAFLMPDGRTLVQTQPITRCVAGGPATALLTFTAVDLYGDGRFGSHGGSGLSAIGGSIRVGEFRPGKPVRHAIKIDVDTPVVLERCATAKDCFRWPAFFADSGASGSYGFQNPNPVPGMKMGALLAIPAGTNINALGLESVPGQMLAWTLQNYGAYIVDSTGGPGFVIGAETGPNGSLRDQFAADFGMSLEQRVNDNTPWSRDMQRLIQALYLVANNGPTSIGGGGTPLQPLAAPLQLPGSAADTIPPTVPGGLAAVPASLQINLSWAASTDNVGVTGYKIFRNGAQVATTGSSAYVDAGLLPLTLYSYTVAAFDAAGNTSAQSAPLSIGTLAASDTQVPTVPAGLVGNAVSSTQINLSWGPSTDNVGVTGYYVYLNDVALTTTTATSFQHTGLTPGTVYNYRVSSYDAAGNNSAWTATPVSVRTLPAPDAQAPSVPTGLVGTALSSTQVKLSWSPSTDNVGVTGYYVYLNDVALTTTTTTSLQQSGLAPGTVYNYRVSSYDAAGNNSAWTATPVSVRTLPAADTPAPSVPSGLKGKAASSTQINLSWLPATDNVGVTGYYIYVNDVALATTTSTSFQHTGLTPGTVYNYRVSSYDAAGNNSAWTATPVSVRTPVRRIASGDLNGDGKSDVLWRNGATGQNAIWLMNGATVASTTIFSTVADLAWSIAGMGDFDGDGKFDIVWRNGATGQNVMWLMNGATISSQWTINWITDFNWKIAGAGDFDGDGKSDILWYNTVTGGIAIWLMNGATIAGGATGFATIADLNWGIAGTGDFDGNGKSDILWHNSVTGENLVWLMNGAAIVSAVSSSPMSDLNWVVAGTGDFDGDGKADILWRNQATGQDAIWFMNGATLSSSPAIGTVADLNWTVAEIGDFNGDGKADILWRNRATGQDTIWFMSGAMQSSGPSTGTVADLNWAIAPR